ncbi:MAG TPA: serine hydrolase domain-containing protein [Edaphobacter sp.]|nr:serine hydrolase domain-containing protein [Edaphobacter sp.]
MPLNLKICACLSALAFLSPAASAATSSNTLFSEDAAERLDHKIEAIVRQNNLPSVAVGIYIPGRGHYTFVDGFADLETRRPRRFDQPFRIASVTKPFAATAILVLVDRGLLKKTDHIDKWYPQFPNADKITIDDLLRMRSGIPAPNDDEVLAQVYDAPLAPAPPLAKELQTYAALKLQFIDPNTVGVYTDFNYDILAGIVQEVTGQDIGTLITETVILPLDLHATLYPTGIDVPGGLHGYGWNPATGRFDDKTLFNPPLAGASGAVISNIADLHTFSRALCKGILLKPETSKEQLEGQPLGSSTNYGEGVAVGHGFCGHSGTINGYSTDMYYIEKLNLSFVINVNRLDRDNKSRSTAILDLVTQTILSELGQTQSPRNDFGRVAHP